MDIFYWTLTCLLMLVGFVGTILPLLPGQIIVLAAAVLHYFTLGPKNSPGAVGYAVLAVLLILSYLLEWGATVLGTKKFGGSKAGMMGAVIGGLVGIFFSLPGLLLGPVVGAMAAELIVARRAWKESGVAATGAAAGMVLGMLGRVGCTVAMIGVFFALSVL